jgi:SagB-type dehydrogenase family enzyme
MRILCLPVVMFFMLLAACDQTEETGLRSPTAAPTGGTGASEPLARDAIELPPPRQAGEPSFEEVLAARRSVREFTSVPLTMEELSQLLWAAQGVTSAWGGRTAPSAGALYPLEVYVATQQGLSHYLPDGHGLEPLASNDLRQVLATAALGQQAVADAPAVLIVTGVYARTASKYGDRAERYVHLEAGHAAQNVLLQAVALGLGAVPIGAFDDRALQQVLGLPLDHQPLYLIPVGHPASADEGSA